MGSRIAAHFANAGIASLLLDIVVPDAPDRSAAAVKGRDTAAKQKPAAFFSAAALPLVQAGNFEDHLGGLAECDWIIEAVTENLAIKRDLWRRVAAVCHPGAILSTNTSGIPLAQISDGFAPEFRRRFLGTHFFNPPRYLHLLEMIPGADTDPEILTFVEDFADRRLGKGVVRCKDTPNFIANRIGSFLAGTILKYMVECGFSVEEVDALTGPLIGLPNSASFRLLDIVGLDVWAFVGSNLYGAVPEDPWRDRFLPAAFQREMLDRKWIGEKAGQGFYKRIGPNREIHVIDWHTLEYHSLSKPKFAIAEHAKQIDDLHMRLRLLVNAEDRAGRFLRSVFTDLIAYSSERIPEIADYTWQIDRAMRWGYGHKLGPFELAEVLDFPHPKLDVPPERPGIIILGDVKRSGGIVQQNNGASLVDLGDGVLCVEFHSKLNTLAEDALSMIHAGLAQLESSFYALVIGNQADHFSAGANLMMVLLAAQEGEWDELNEMVTRFQQMNMAIKYAAKPVVVAPFGQTLGGGCEITLHAPRVQASAETYMGLVEAGVGLIPAGGGCKEMLLRLGDARRAFELIGYAKVSGSACEARDLGFLRPGDAISMNPERLIGDAKALARSLVDGYAAPAQGGVKVSGNGAYAPLKLGVWTAQQGHFISDYDAVIGEKLAYVLSGGRLTGEQTVSEQYLLDLEREAFLSLCGNAKTQERMAHTLKTGKPLRN